MQPTQDNYPVFEANQVLTNAHLNQIFDYLDEQQRLTRANLIGIGIVCGLNVSLDDAALPKAIQVSKGCGVTSEGYLIVEPGDATLTSYRSYTLPEDIAYPAFKNSATDQPYSLWELFPEGEPETTPLTSPSGFLDDKAVLLFLELKKEELRNCSANNCDDKGAKVTATVRPLLIGKADLDAIIAAAEALPTAMPDSALQLNLPDLRLPRYDAPATSPSTSNDVLASFLAVFRTKKLAAALGNALSEAYQAFQPILKGSYESDPFANFAAQFGFLDTVPVTVNQVRFLPYYYDLFDDLIRAYDEFRDKGTELWCACCPPSGLFPRHLMLGLLFPASESEAGTYRHSFIASAAINGCESRTQDLLTLFRRIVEMSLQFTVTPLPPPAANAPLDSQIRITPSKLGHAPLSAKAIPYYYLQNGKPPLYRLWNPALTRRSKANRNQGYRAGEYTPPAPVFVTEPLAYDLEPYNFLRIEGHLGKPYQSVLKSLLNLKSRYRLPFELIALRTGAFDDTIPVDLSRESCRFQDLDTLYASTRGETLCLLVKTLTYFYNIGFESTSPVTTPVPSQFAVINQFAPGFLVQLNSLGRLFEDYITSQGGVVPEIDANVMASWINIFPPQDSLVYYSFFYLIKLADALPAEFSAVNFTTVETRFKNLGIVVTAIEKRREQGRSQLDGNTAVLDWEEIDDRLEDLLNTCLPAVLQSIRNHYENRIKELKKMQFLSSFLQEHSGIQHKAGVPVGGTFIVVYHQDPVKTPGLAPPQNLSILGSTVDPMASGVLLSVHTGAANLNDFVFKPILFDFISPRRPALSIPIVGDAAAVASTTATKTDTAKPSTGRASAARKIKGNDTAQLNASAARVASDNKSAVRTDRKKTESGIDSPEIVRAGSLSLRPELAGINLSAGAAGTEQPTVSQAIRDAIERLQAQPVASDPDIRIILDGLNALIPVLPAIPIFPGTPELPTEADKIIAAAVNGLADGTVIADFYLPYLCCSDCAPIQYVLPKTPPTFSVSIGCTDASQEVPAAEVTVTAKDGTPPYRIQFDEQDFQALNNPYLLSVGEHRLILQDADNVLSLPQTIRILEPLGIGEPSFTCTSDGLTYVANVPIIGGEPPYSVNDAPISGATFTSSAVASGKPLKLRITDHRQCVFETEVSHTCPPPCDLPCDGQSRRCAYRLWLQPAVEGSTYTSYKQESALKLRFNGKDIEIPDSNTLLQVTASQLNGNFQDAMGSVIQKMNDVINQALVAALGPSGKNRLVITFAPVQADPFGTLQIEHFICDTFNIEFDYSFAKPTPAFSLIWRYTNEPAVTGAPFNGAVMINRRLDNKETRVPAFDCSERNQCLGSDFKKLCEGPDPKPSISGELIGSNLEQFQGSVENMPPSDIVGWVWDVLIARPTEPFYEGQTVESQAQFIELGGPVRLTAITKKGCFGAAQIIINIIL